MKTIRKEIDINAHIENITCEVKVEEGNPNAIIGFDNLGNGTITAIKFNAKGYNSFGDIIKVEGEESFVLIIQDISIAKNSKAKDLKVALPNRDIRKLDLSEAQICFSDGRVVSYEGKASREIDIEVYDKYGSEQDSIYALKNKFGVDFRNKPIELKEGWICGCGRFNKTTDDVCTKCRNTRSEVMKYASDSEVENLVSQYKNEKKREEDNYNQTLKQKENKKNIKVISVVTLCILVIVIAVYLKTTGNNPNEQVKNSISQETVVESVKETQVPKASNDEIKGYIKRITSDFIKNTDEFNEIDFLYYPSIAQKTNSGIDVSETLYAYIAMKDTSKPVLHLVVRYKGYSWLFFNKAQIKLDDRKITIFDNVQSYDKLEEVLTGGNVLEKYDMHPVSNTLINDLMNLNSKNTYTMRLNGTDHYKDIEIKPSTVKALQETIECYKSINKVIETGIIPETETTETTETEDAQNGELETKLSLFNGANGYIVDVSFDNKTGNNYALKCTINIFDKDGNIISSRPYDTFIEAYQEFSQKVQFGELNKEASRCNLIINEKTVVTDIVETTKAFFYIGKYESAIYKCLDDDNQGFTINISKDDDNIYEYTEYGTGSNEPIDMDASIENETVTLTPVDESIKLIIVCYNNGDVIRTKDGVETKCKRV